MKGNLKRFLCLGSLGLTTLISSHIYAAGYKLEFQSTSVLADSGDAAVVEDAGTNWYNSAGLVYLPRQVVASGIGIYNATTFGGTATAPSIFGPAFSYNFSGHASSHVHPFLPALHYNVPLSKRISIGMSFAPAWGLLNDYGEGSILRYSLTRIYTRSMDVSPSLAYKFDDHWSVGLGPDFHYFSVISKNHVRTEGPPGFGGTVGDSLSRFSASSWDTGAHIGILYHMNDTTRIGANYRTKINQRTTGHSAFYLDGVGNFETAQFRLNIPLPPVVTLSAYHDMSPCFAVMGTLTYDGWSSLHDYHGVNYIQPPTPGNASGLLPSVVSVQKMNDTVDVSAGFHYKYNDQIMIRGSLKYEPTPTRSAYRYVNFPDGAKLGVNIGGHYQVAKTIGVDFIYAHVFCQAVNVNDVNIVTGATATGRANTSINLAGAQVVWNF